MKSNRKMGNTDKLAWFLIALLVGTTLASFILAFYSIRTQYTGALVCWTACIAPTDTALAIVLKAVVEKNKQENTGADGEGIRYRQILAEMEGGN